MTRRVDWDNMFEDIMKAYIKVEAEIKAIGLDAQITISTKPPRINIMFSYPKGTYTSSNAELVASEDVKDEFLVTLHDNIPKFDEIMSRNSLKRYGSFHPRRRPDKFILSYGLDHSRYHIAR